MAVPVIANGNVLFHPDIDACLAATGADAVMSAEGNLYNPALFLSSASAAEFAPTDDALPSTWCIAADTGLHLPHTRLALEYLALVRAQRTPTRPSAVKGHLFKLLRPALAREVDLRDALGNVRGKAGAETWDRYEAIVRDFDARMLVRHPFLPPLAPRADCLARGRVFVCSGTRAPRKARRSTS